MMSMSPSAENDSVRSISRFFVAYDHRRHNEHTLVDAIALAGQARAEVVVLFIQDESLLRLATLPFAHEINRTFGLPVLPAD
ncbi:MAG: hypothetical protein WBD34_19645 [Burkholderiaceae bacterium]